MTVSYQNQQAIRRQPITPTLEARIREAVSALGPGYTAQVYSGGQPSAGKGRRIGSTRHDGGKAADIYITGPDGKRVNDNSLFGKVKDYWHSKGYGGVGIGMAGGGIHLDEHTDRPNFWTYNGLPKTAFSQDMDQAMRAGNVTPQQALARALGARKPQPKLTMKPDGLTGAPQAVAPAPSAAAMQQMAAIPDAADPQIFQDQLQNVMSVETPDGVSALAKALAAGLVSYQQGTNDKRMKDRQAAITQNLSAMIPDGPNKSLIMAMAASNPKLLEQFAIAQATKDPADDEMRALQIEKMRAETERIKNPPQRDNLSLNPIYMKDAQGNTVIGQLGADGVMRQTQLPEGASVATGVDRVDLGTSVALIDKRTGQIVGTQPKDIAGEASAKKSGEAQGVAAVELRETLGTIDDALNVLGQVEKDPALPNNVGIISQYNPYISQSGTDFSTKVDQMSSQTFLNLADTLKGVLTDRDAKELKQAGARLSRAQSEPAFRAALAEYKAILQRTRQNAIAKAGGQATIPAQPQPSAPQPAQPAPAQVRRIRLDAQGNIIP